MNKEKKLIITSIVLLIIGGFYLILKPKTYTEINFQEYMNKFESSNPFVLFIGSSECGHCTIFKKTANRIINEYNIKINYIDLDKLTKEEYAHIKAHFPFDSTPTTIVINEGEELSRISGAKNFEDSVELLKKGEVIE